MSFINITMIGKKQIQQNLHRLFTWFSGKKTLENSNSVIWTFFSPQRWKTSVSKKDHKIADMNITFARFKVKTWKCLSRRRKAAGQGTAEFVLRWNVCALLPFIRNERGKSVGVLSVPGALTPTCDMNEQQLMKSKVVYLKTEIQTLSPPPSFIRLKFIWRNWSWQWEEDFNWGASKSVRKPLFVLLP